jgi:hypothetical protein
MRQTKNPWISIARRQLSLASAVAAGNSNGIARFERCHHR